LSVKNIKNNKTLLLLLSQDNCSIRLYITKIIKKLDVLIKSLLKFLSLIYNNL